MSTPDPFAEPGPTGGGKMPSMAQLKGRLLLVTPTGIEKGITSPLKKTPHDRITADVVILDGDPIKGVLNKDGEVTHVYDTPLAPPHRLDALWISQMVLVNQLRNALKSEGMVLGRVTQLPAQTAGNNKAWSLDAATEDDKKVARAYIESQKVDENDPFASA